MRLLLFCFIVLAIGCGQQAESTGSLPILGNWEVVSGDTIHHKIRDFAYLNQDSLVITNDFYKDKAYVAEFFFTSCPTICPKIKQQLLRINQRFIDDDRLAILSYSIDLKYDKVPRLKEYADKLDIKGPKWSLVEGQEDDYDIAEDYMSIAYEDDRAPGGYNHSGFLVLVDKNRHIRSYCVGTDADDVDLFMGNIQRLLDEDY